MESQVKQRKAVDFGFDVMEYEDSSKVHSTNLVWKLDKSMRKKLKLKDLVLASRVSSNGNKSLTLTQTETGDQLRLDFIKRL